MSRDEFVGVLEQWVDGTLGSGEWDYFEGCELSDPQLEALRKHCCAISLDPVLTVDPQRSWRLNDLGKAEVRALILKARLQDAAN